MRCGDPGRKVGGTVWYCLVWPVWCCVMGGVVTLVVTLVWCKVVVLCGVVGGVVWLGHVTEKKL